MKIHIYSLKNKIAVLVLLIVATALLISGISIYTYMYSILSKTIIKDNTAILSNLNEHLAYTVESTRQYAKNIIIDDGIQNALRIKGSLATLDYDYYSKVSKIDNRLNEYLTLRDNIIDDIYILDPRFEAMTNKEIKAVSIKEWPSNSLDQSTFSKFTGKHGSSGRTSDIDAEVISYVTVIHDKSRSGVLLGYLVIDLKYSQISNILKNDLGSINQLKLSSPDSILLRTGDPMNESQIILTQKIPETDWEITGFISKMEITRQILMIGLRFILILIVCLIPIALIILPVVNNVTRPIYVLIRAMKEFSLGRLKKEIEVHSRDELELLARGFNSMVIAIRQNMEDLVLKQKKERELELSLLMKQLNPHFIYNTLNCIIYLARRIEAKEIEDLTKSFIMLLQQTAKMLPDEKVTLEEELHFIQTYISILKYRYEDKVQFTVDIDPSLHDFQIPKLLLYPLVENSVFHGLLPLSEVGQLTVSAKRIDHAVEISVTDNGVGLTPSQLTEIQQFMKRDFSDATSTSHIGLRNVYQRLILHYGHQGTLVIESEPYVRTGIILRIPLS